ncbi:response regulator receiver domain-containing protein 5 [Elsinoe australis]|uniref:Response regulator receiver domain-containing protein 5 n=1 Tax=Elsinoe australis TaxID=40998 RepID=A0A4U7B3T0_9PEZI|nr:response regulator receiver domain-containing protein 5 [Elsinoe australis]
MSDSAETIMSCALHSKRITDDILCLSKLDSSLLEISPSAFSIKAFLQQVQSAFTPEATHAKVTLATEIDPSIKQLNIRWVTADSGRLMQILVNLVANAIKFTRDGNSTRSVTVTVGASPTASIEVFRDLIVAGRNGSPKSVHHSPGVAEFFLWFRVRDTGCGMDADGRARIFSRFKQASPKTYNKYGGSGLGLFISQKLATLQGGEIGFRSEIGCGSTFAFYITAQMSNPPETQHSNSFEPLALQKNGSNAPANGENLHRIESPPKCSLSVLLVEDNLVNQKVLSKQLTRHGYHVSTADNGKHAFECIQSSRHWKQASPSSSLLPAIDVILMDVEMPIVDGLACTRMIRTAQEDGLLDEHIPIIAITANARPEQLRRTIGAGMDDAVSKPFRVADLVTVINRVVNRLA